MAGQRCKICSHARRAEAEALIASGVSVRKTAARLGLPVQSLDRHQRNCARQTIEKAVQAREAAIAEQTVSAEVERGSQLAARVEELQQLTMQLFDEARNGRTIEVANPKDPNKPQTVYIPPDPKEARLAIGTARKNLELLGRLNGELDPEKEGERPGVTFEELELIWKRRRVEVGR